MTAQEGVGIEAVNDSLNSEFLIDAHSLNSLYQDKFFWDKIYIHFFRGLGIPALGN
jgi:hypothetical protein